MIKSGIQKFSYIGKRIWKGVYSHNRFPYLPGSTSRILLIGILIFSNDGFILLSNHSNVLGSINKHNNSVVKEVRDHIRITSKTLSVQPSSRIMAFNHPAFNMAASTVIGNIPNFRDYSAVSIDTTTKTKVHIRLPKKVYTEDLYKIMGTGHFNAEQLARFVTINNNSINYSKVLHLAKLYIKQALLEGVNHDIAFIQMCHETGFLRYNGVVSPDQNNFCGLGTINDYTPGEVFNSPEEGITAHIQHLKAYACKEDLKGELVDRRFRFVKRGIAPHVKDLTGRWATDQLYAEKIHKLIQRLNAQLNS